MRHSSSEYLGSPNSYSLEVQLHHLAGEVLDGADLVEQLPQPVIDEPAERLELELDQIGDRQDFGDPRVTLALRSDDSVAPGGFSDRQHQALLAGDRNRGTAAFGAQGHTTGRERNRGNRAHRTGSVLLALYAVNYSFAEREPPSTLSLLGGQ